MANPTLFGVRRQYDENGGAHWLFRNQTNHATAGFNFAPRDGYAFGRRLPADLAYQLGGIICDRVDRYGCFQIIGERPAARPSIFRVRPADPMHQFGNGDGRQRGLPLAEFLDDLSEELGDVELLSFRLDNNTRVEDYSQDGGFQGWLRLAMPFSTSFIKPSSSVTVEPRASARAMHSDNNRPLGSGERMTATGCPDVVILDIQMPIMNGLEAARDSFFGLAPRSIFVTLLADPYVVQAALSLGASGYLVKSRAALDLTHAIDSAMLGQSFVSPPESSQFLLALGGNRLKPRAGLPSAEYISRGSPATRRGRAPVPSAAGDGSATRFSVVHELSTIQPADSLRWADRKFQISLARLEAQGWRQALSYALATDKP